MRRSNSLRVLLIVDAAAAGFLALPSGLVAFLGYRADREAPMFFTGCLVVFFLDCVASLEITWLLFLRAGLGFLIGFTCVRWMLEHEVQGSLFTALAVEQAAIAILCVRAALRRTWRREG